MTATTNLNISCAHGGCKKVIGILVKTDDPNQTSSVVHDALADTARTLGWMCVEKTVPDLPGDPPRKHDLWYCSQHAGDL